jgi:hypothetical protein
MRAGASLRLRRWCAGASVLLGGTACGGHGDGLVVTTTGTKSPGASGVSDGAAVGASGVSAGAAADAGPPWPFENYELTGTWPSLAATTAKGPIQQTRGALTYRMVQVHDQFLAQSCAIADYNHDGIPDISSGRRWYQGPDFQTAHIFRGSPFATPGHDALPRSGAPSELQDGESDDQADYPFDVDGDGWVDVIDIGATDYVTTVSPAPQPQEPATGYWYKNPGMPAVEGDAAWTPNLIHTDIRHEQHGLVDVDGDGKPEIFGACRMCGETKGYYQADWTNPTAPWIFHPVTRLYQFPFGGTGKLHGLGFADVDGDGKPDLLERSGIWLQPSGGASAPPPAAEGCTGYACSPWPWVPQTLSGYVLAAGEGPSPDLSDGDNSGGSHMFAFDVDGDGDQDVISADWAHGWGLSWYEQTMPVGSCIGFPSSDTAGGTPADASVKQCFVRHPITGTNDIPDLAAYHVAFSQPHAMQLVDMDGDGLPDIITGKEWMAQPYQQGDPDPDGTPVLYVFRLVRDASPPQSGKAHFEPHLVNAAVPAGVARDAGAFPAKWSGGSGIGTQVAIGQINPQTDAIMDICIASKLGLFVYLGQ